MSSVITLGTRYRTIRSQVGSIAVNPGNVATLELPRSFLYKTLILRLNGTINNTAVLTTLPNESPLPLIAKVEVVADGRKVLVSAAGRDLFRLAHIYRGKHAELVAPTTAINASNPFQATIVVDFEAARMAVPLDSFFDPRPFEKVELRITFGQTTDAFPSGTTPTFNAGSQVDVQLNQTTEGAPNVLFNRLHLFDEFTVAAASTNFTINIPRSGLLAGILIRTTNANATPIQVTNAVLNRISLKSDNNFLHADTLNATELQAFNVVEAQLDRYLSAVGQPGPGTYDQSFIGRGIDGYYFLDLTEDGLVSSALNTFDLNVLQLILDVNNPAGTNVIRCTYVFYEPVAAR